MNSTELISKHKSAIALLRKIGVREDEKAAFQRQANLKYISDKQRETYRQEIVNLNGKIVELVNEYNSLKF